MNNNNLVDLIAQNKNYENHRKKIASILTHAPGSTQTFDNRRIKVVNTFYSNHDKAARYSSKNKQEAIQKENDLILKKIIQVNNRRNQSLSGVSPITRNYSHNSLSNLKKSLQSINHENQKLAQKLVGANSNLSQVRMSESYRKHLERKERLKKFEYDEQVGMVIPKKIRSLQKLKNLESLKQQMVSSRLYGDMSRGSGDPEER